MNPTKIDFYAPAPGPTFATSTGPEDRDLAAEATRVEDDELGEAPPLEPVPGDPLPREELVSENVVRIGPRRPKLDEVAEPLAVVVPMNGRRPRAKRGGEAPPPSREGLPTIRTGADLHRVINEAEQVLTRDPHLYTRGGTLVHVVPREADARARVRREEGAPAIRTLTKPAIRDALSAVANWQKYDKRSEEWVACAPPADVAESLLARGSWPSLRSLSGIATSPILRPDGSVAQVPGYDPGTGYLLAFEPGDPIPAKPTRAEALAARDRVLALVEDFPFADEADRAAWLALPMTMTCRAAITGPVPLWCITANIRGSGKSKLADVPAVVRTGRCAARATWPADEAEMGKVLTSIAVEADPLVLFDNVDRPLGSGKLEAWLTGDRWADRLLGSNARIDMPIVTVLAVTGNNLEPRGDMLRRVLPVRLESDLERPESRTDFRIPDLLAHVRDHRQELARDLVIMAAAWFAAGSPKADGVPAWGSFDDWVAIVPNVLRWLDLPDPMHTREGLEEDDPTLTALRTVLGRWMQLEALAGTNGLTVRELVERVYDGGRPRDGLEDVAAALEVLAPGVGRERIDGKRLGYVVRHNKGRRIGGRKLTRASATHEGGLRWTVR